MTRQNKKLMELAMVASIQKFTKEQTPNCRLKNLYSRLSKAAMSEIQRIPKVTKLESYRIGKLVDDFAISTGWIGKEKHIATLVSFCLCLIEDSESKFSPKITDTMNDIINYLEDGRKLPQPSLWAGGLAANKWKVVMEGA